MDILNKTGNNVLPIVSIPTRGDDGGSILQIRGEYAWVQSSLYITNKNFELLWKSDESLNPTLVMGTNKYASLYMWMDGAGDGAYQAAFIYKVTWKNGNFLMGLYTGGSNTAILPVYYKSGFQAFCTTGVALYDPYLYN